MTGKSTRFMTMVLAIVIVLGLMPLVSGYRSHADSDTDTDFYVPLTIASGFNIDGIYEEGGSSHSESALDSSGYCYYSYSEASGSLPPGGLIDADGKLYQLGNYGEKNVLKLTAKSNQAVLSFSEASQDKYKKLAFIVTGGNGGGTLEYTVNFDGIENTENPVTGTFIVPDWASTSTSYHKVYACGRCYTSGSIDSTTPVFGLYECQVEIPADCRNHKVVSVSVFAKELSGDGATICVFAVSGIGNSSKYSVIFNGNGGTPAVGSMSAEPNGEITLPAATWKNHTFDGWYDKSSGVKAGDAGDNYAVTKNIVLTAEWTENPYIWGYMNTGSSSGEKKYYRLDDGTFEKPVYNDYEFLGWSETPAGTVIPDSQLVPGNEYYAIWKKSAYDIYVQGVRVTNANCGDILGNGTVSFDPATYTMTLNNATINTPTIYSWDTAAGIYMDDYAPQFNIVLKGSNKIIQSANTDRGHVCGIYSYAKTTNINGSGTLDITVGQSRAESGDFYGLEIAYDLVIEGVKINVVNTGGDYTRAVYLGDGSLSLRNGASVIANTIGAPNNNDKCFYIEDYLYVDGTSYLEATSSYIAIDPDDGVGAVVKEIGALVNTKPTAAGAVPWNRETNFYSGGYKYVRIPQVHNHTWDAGVVTKQPTTTAEGEKTYTCKLCGETKTEKIDKLPDPAKEMGTDGTAYGPGASAQAAEAAILALTNDKDPKGTVFGVLQLKAAKTTKNSIKLAWKKAPGAKSYIIYSNACGKDKKYQKLQTTTKTSVTIKKVAGKKLAKGKYYKFLMVAVDASGKVVSTSKTVHAATAGSKVGNPTKITTKAKKNKVTVKVKKTFKLAAKQVDKKIKKHRAVSYESSNPAVATVTAKGVIKGVKKGKCKVYAYAQNGVCAVINVTVK